MLGSKNLWLVLCLWNVISIVAEIIPERGEFHLKNATDLHKENRQHKGGPQGKKSYSSVVGARSLDQNEVTEETKFSKKLYSSILDPEYTITHYGGYVETYTQHSSGSITPTENLKLDETIAKSGGSEHSYNDTIGTKDNKFAQGDGDDYTLHGSNNSYESDIKVSKTMESANQKISRFTDHVWKINYLYQTQSSEVTKYEVNLDTKTRDISSTEFIGTLKNFIINDENKKLEIFKKRLNEREQLLDWEYDYMKDHWKDSVWNKYVTLNPYVFIAFPLSNSTPPIREKKMKDDWSKYNPNNKNPGFESVFREYWGLSNLSETTHTEYKKEEHSTTRESEDTSPVFIDHSTGIIYGILNLKLGKEYEQKPLYKHHSTNLRKHAEQEGMESSKSRYCVWAWPKREKGESLFEMLDFEIEIDYATLKKRILNHGTLPLLIGAADMNSVMLSLIENHSPEETEEVWLDIPHGGEL